MCVSEEEIGWFMCIMWLFAVTARNVAFGL